MGEAAESVRTGPVGSSRGTASEGREPSSSHVASATGIRDCSSPYLASPFRAGIKTRHGSDPGMTQTSQEVSRLMICGSREHRRREGRLGIRVGVAHQPGGEAPPGAPTVSF